MLRFTLGAAPESAGIYLIRNIKTKRAYVGKSVNLRRRLQEWRGLACSQMGRSNKVFAAALRDSQPTDWEFVIMRSGVPIEDLDQLEARAIKHTRARIGDRCLNHEWERKKKLDKPQYKSTRLSVVLGPNGPMTHREVAAAVGCGPGQVAKKLKSRRDRGITSMTLEEYKIPGWRAAIG